MGRKPIFLDGARLEAVGCEHDGHSCKRRRHEGVYPWPEAICPMGAMSRARSMKRCDPVFSFGASCYTPA